jgi:hypothetical protein
VIDEALVGVPEWLLAGVVGGVVVSLLFAGVFAVGARLFPTEPRASARSFGGTSRRRAEIRAYLDTIDEQYAENHFVEGQEVAFYLPKRDVAITFDPRAYYRIQRSPTDPVLVEHEMPGVNLGYRLPFETPDLDLGQEDDETADPRDAAFAVLGVPSSATLPQVKSAYREKVKEVHPDHGGDRESFRRVREAYTTAKEYARV